VTLRDPEVCPACKADRQYRVIESKRRKGYRRRVHRCHRCGFKWPVFITTIDPRNLHSRPYLA
jgi:transposase-like protein